MRRQVWLGATLGLALAACSPQQAASPAIATPVEPAPAVVVAPASGEGPALVNGLYVAKNACPGEACYLQGKIKAYEAADLFDKAGPGASIIGQVAQGEWVEIVATEEHLVPRRGVVSKALGPYAVGDVIYLLGSQGEGCADAWSKGASTSWCDPETGLEADTSPPLDFAEMGPAPDGVGLWVKVKRAQGGEGWVKDVFNGFACTSQQDRDADCPAVP